MTQTNANRRTQRTRRKLKDMLILLLQTRELEKISIRELAELSDISRGTFYLHYADIFALYQAVEDEVVDGITQAVNAAGPPQDGGDLEGMMVTVLEYLSLHLDACEALLKVDSASFLAKVFARNRQSGTETWEAVFGSREHTQAYAYIFISYGFAGILRHWMAYGRRETPRQIAVIVNELLSGYRPLVLQKASASDNENSSGNQS